ncbi:MAG: FAD:protein FMN transferase [Bacteroidota bacterium]
MGTTFRITISTPDTAGLVATIRRSFRRIDALEQSMSDYRSDSELNHLVGSTERQSVSSDLYTVLRFSKKLARRSKGAFDPTIGPLSKLWRRAFRQQAFPEKERILSARARVQWRRLKIGKPNRVRLRREDVQLDLGGVAKGYTLDVVGKLLREAGFPAFLIDGGGDLLLGEAPHRGEWKVEFTGGYTVSHLSETAVVTSGDTYRYLEHQGQRYSHIIDPRTGLGLQNSRPITVTGPSAMVADALASAYSVNPGNWAKAFQGYELSGPQRAHKYR